MTTSLMHLDWIRAVRFWLLVGGGLAAWEAAVCLGGAPAVLFGDN